MYIKGLLQKINHKKFLGGIALSIVFFLIGTMIFPIFNREPELDIIEIKNKSEQTNPTNTQMVDTGAYIHHYAPDGSFGATHVKFVNWSYWKSWLNDMFDWRLRASTDGDNWVDANQGLTVDLNWSEENNTCKVSLILNTSEAPVPLFYNFDLLVNSDIKSYVNKSSNYEYLLTLPCNNTEDENYNLVFNWSDMIPLIENNTITVKKGVTNITGNDSFYFRIFTVNKINPDIEFVVDPLFGGQDTTGGVRNVVDRVEGSIYTCPTSGVADNISVYIRSRDQSNDWYCAIYTSDGATLLGYTEERAIGPEGSFGWETFEFTGGGPSLIESTDYLLVVTGDSISDDCLMTDDAGAGNTNNAYTDSHSYSYGSLPEPHDMTVRTGEGDYTIYCSYTENATVGTDTSMTNFSYYKKITINSSLVGCDLTNFPILVHNTSSNFSDHARPDGYDFVFMNYTNETKYNHEIERFDNSTGELIAWVNITDLNSSSDTELWLWYGNGTTGTQENVADTWDSDYIGVWHMNDGGSTNITDSTIYGHDGTATNTPTEVTGFIGNCYDFDSDTDYFTISNDTNLDASGDVTMSCWYNVDSDTIVALMSRNFIYGDYHYQVNDEGRYHIRWEGGSGAVVENVYYESQVEPQDVWMMATVTRDDTAKYVYWYHNGSSIGYDTYSDSPIDSNDDLYIGTEDTSPSQGMDGSIDEVRISKIKRSSDWIGAEYNTTMYKEDGQFITVGTEQEPSVPSGEDWNVINNTVNGSYVNTTTWNEEINNINGSYTNTTVFQEVDNTINGSWNNITAYNEVLTTINGSYTNTTAFSEVNNSVNGTYTNTTGFSIINNSVNGSWVNGSTWNTVNNSINGSYVNTSLITWYETNTTVNGSYSNLTTWSVVNNSVNGSYTNITAFQNVNDTINGTWNNVSHWWHTANNTVNGSWTNTTPPAQISITNIYPSNHSNNIPLQPNVYANFSSLTGQTMNVSWYYGNSTTNCTHLMGTDSNIANSTQYELYFSASNRSRDYYWRIQADDGTVWVNETLEFKTEGYAGGGGGGRSPTIALAIAVGGIIFSLFALLFIFKKRKK